MDVDAIRKATTDMEKEKYRSEGRCFNCGRQGHLSRNCPDKKPRIAAAITTTPSTSPPVPIPAPPPIAKPKAESREEKIRRIAQESMSLTADEQETLAEELKRQGVDFQ